MNDRDKNRERFPETAAVVDMFRAAADKVVPGTGKGIRLLGAVENERTIGKLYEHVVRK